MSSASEPSVEVLTAEMRVLQVGSKPIALSAARQLDSVDGAAIRPFGRVRIDPKPADGLIEVVGSVNGVLARSSACARKVECPGYAAGSSSRGYGLPRVVCRLHCDTSALDSAASHEWMEYTPSQEIYEAWLALPLIVLAGLRLLSLTLAPFLLRLPLVGDDARLVVPCPVAYPLPHAVDVQRRPVGRDADSAHQHWQRPDGDWLRVKQCGLCLGEAGDWDGVGPPGRRCL